MDIKYSTEEDVLNRAKEIYESGIHPFRLLDINNRLDRNSNKGNLGQIIEEGWFGIDVNSRHEKDFLDANLELKVIPYLKKDKGISGKERLVVTMINYSEEAKASCLEESSFWKKADNILLMTYEHKYDTWKGDYFVDYAKIHKFSPEDIEIIRNDWEIIHSYIVEGRAHELSESLTSYLGACTKGMDGSVLVNQYNNTIKAQPRAFCLKSSYISSIIKKSLTDDFYVREKEVQYSFGSPKKVNIIEYRVLNLFSQHLGKSIGVLSKEFFVDFESKSINNSLITRMVNRSDSTLIDTLKKSNTIIKTITINTTLKVKESMSFPTFRFQEIINESWIESRQREYFEDLRILFVVFQNIDNIIRLKKVFFYTLKEHELSNICIVYEKLRKILIEGNVYSYNSITNSYSNRLPKIKDNTVTHIRPHASKADYSVNGQYADYIPSDNKWMTNQCFWLNAKYIESIIKINLK